MLAAAALAGIVFAVYAAGACPTIYVGDSGDLVTAVHVLGIPHPTGYPLYVLLGKLWSVLIPVGTVAWRMSLFSAVCAAAACGALYRLCRSLALHPVAAAFSALVLAFSPSFWSEANVQRVYGLGALFVVLATTAAWRWQVRRDGKSLAWASFLCGLGAANHAFMAVYALALGGLVLTAEPAILRSPRRVMAAGGAFCAGLLPYLYLPLRARAHPPLAWGDPQTLGGFFRVVSRREFWGRAWLEGPADLPVIAANYLGSFRAELTWAGVALALVGTAAGRRRRWPVLLPGLVMAGNFGLLAAHGSRHDLFTWHRYYIPSYVMAAFLAGLGAQVVLERLPAMLRFLPLMVPALLLALGWRTFDRSRYRIAEDFGTAVLQSLPPGAHLAGADDNVLFTLMYLHLVEQRRPDVDLIMQGVGGMELPPLRFDPENDPLFFTHHPNWDHPLLDVVPVGLVFRVWPARRPPPPAAATAEALDGERDPRVPKDDLTRSLIGHFHYMRGVTFARGDWPRARREFALAGATADDDDVLFYNLGLVFQRNGLLEDALAAFRRSHAINPRHLASQRRPRATDRVAELTAEEKRLEAIEEDLVRDPTLLPLAPDTPAYHRQLATLLERQGEPLAAHGHRLKALEIDAGA